MLRAMFSTAPLQSSPEPNPLAAESASLPNQFRFNARFTMEQAREIVTHIAQERNIPAPELKLMDPRNSEYGLNRASYSPPLHVIYLGSSAFANQAEGVEAVTHEMEHAAQMLFVAASALAHPERCHPIPISPIMMRTADARGLQNNQMFVRYGSILGNSMRLSATSNSGVSQAGYIIYHDSLVELCATIAGLDAKHDVFREQAKQLRETANETQANSTGWRALYRSPLAKLQRLQAWLADSRANQAAHERDIKIDRVSRKFCDPHDLDIRGPNKNRSHRDR